MPLVPGSDANKIRTDSPNASVPDAAQAQKVMGYFPRLSRNFLLMAQRGSPALLQRKMRQPRRKFMLPYAPCGSHEAAFHREGGDPGSPTDRPARFVTLARDADLSLTGADARCRRGRS